MTAPQPPAAATDPSRRVIRPLTDFLQTESAGGILLAIGAGVGIGLPPTPRKPAGRPSRAARDDGGKPPARGGAGGPYRKRRR